MLQQNYSCCGCKPRMQCSDKSKGKVKNKPIISSLLEFEDTGSITFLSEMGCDFTAQIIPQPLLLTARIKAEARLRLLPEKSSTD